VIDYTREDFTTNGNTYDLIFDVGGGTTFDRCQNSLKPNGVFLQNIMELTDIVRSFGPPSPVERKSRVVWPSTT
jgi:NADPH:quinone reductase-like Zn-dependent oxidoreductase